MQRALLASTAVWLAAIVSLAIPAAPASAAVSVSGPRAVSDPVSRLAEGPQTAPAVAFGAGRYLAVWTDGRADETTEVWAARLTPTGAVLDPSGILVSSSANDAELPAVTFDGTNFLVAWERNGNIIGARVSAAGRVLDSPAFVISAASGAQGDPAVASNGSGSLVVWQDGRAGNNDVFAARVSSAGDVVDPGGVAVSTAGNAETRPAVTFDGQNYFAVWEDARSGASDIRGSRISPSNTVLNPNGIVVAAAANAQAFPDVTSNGTASLVVWHDFRTGAFADIRATRVTRAGAVLDPTGIVVSDAARDQFEPEVSFDGADYLVAWTDLREGPLVELADIFASRVTPAGANLDGDGFAISAAGSGQFRPAVATNGTTTLAVWTDVRNADFDVEAARVNRSGVVLDPNGIVVTRAASVQSQPSVASDGTPTWSCRSPCDRQVCTSIAWYSGVGERRRERGRRGAGTRRAGRGEGRVDTGSRSWTARFYEGPAGPPGRGEGLVADRPCAVAATKDPERNPSVASDGTNFLVTWTLLDDTFTEVARARRVSAAGALLGTSPVSLAPVTTDQLDPAVGFNGSRYLVVWTERHADIDIFGTQVTTNGATVGTRGFVVTDASEDQDEPDVAGNGNFLVVWTDRRQDGGDVFGTRISPAGTVLDGDGSPIAASSTNELQPAVTAGPTDDDPFGLAYQRFAPEPPLGAPRVFLRTSPK